MNFYFVTKKKLILHTSFVPDCLDDDLDNVARKAVIRAGAAEAGMGSHTKGCELLLELRLWEERALHGLERAKR